MKLHSATSPKRELYVIGLCNGVRKNAGRTEYVGTPRGIRNNRSQPPRAQNGAEKVTAPSEALPSASVIDSGGS